MIDCLNWFGVGKKELECSSSEFPDFPLESVGSTKQCQRTED